MWSKRDPITAGSGDSWFWAFGLLTLAPAVLSEAGLVQSAVAWFTEAAPSVTLIPNLPSVEPSTVAPPGTGSVPVTSTWHYVLLAVLLLLTGRCQDLLKYMPRLVLLVGAAISGWIISQGGAWFLPAAMVPIATLALIIQRMKRHPGARENLRTLAILFGLWALCSPVPYVGITMIALGGFGVVKPSRLSTATPLVVAAAAWTASTLAEGTSISSISRYLLYGIFAFGVIYQFGRYGTLKSAGPLLAVLIIAFSSISTWGSLISESFAQADWVATQAPLSSGHPNWIEFILLVILLLVARWLGFVIEQNSEVIVQLRNSKRTPRYLRRALKASGPMLGLAAALWIVWFAAASMVQRASIHAYAANASALNGACPDRVVYTATPEPSDYVTTVRLEIERDRLEMKRCFAYKVNQGVDASQKSVAEVSTIAKETFFELWPERLPGTQTETCGFLNVVCLLKNGVKSIVNRRYQKLKGSAIAKFNEEIEAEAARLIAVSGSTGETLENAVLSRLDEQAAIRHSVVIEAARKSRLMGIAFTAYLMFLAAKLYLSVLARFVFHTWHRSVIPVTSLARGAVKYKVVPQTVHGRMIDVSKWQFSKSLSIANCGFRARRPYSPRFAIFRRLRRWYLTNSAYPLSADPPCLIEPPLDVILKVTLEKDSAVVFDPRDLIGFMEDVEFVGEWNFRLIALVYCRHRFWLAKGPGEILLRLPHGATSNETSSGVNTIMVHSADADYGVSGSRSVWDVAFTPETIQFPGKNTTWIAPQRKWRARIRSLRAFLLPV